MAKKTAKKTAKKGKRTIRARRPKAANKSGKADLKTITTHLRDRMKSRAPISYDRGRQRMATQIMDVLECSETRAEHIVSSLVARGFVRFGPHPLYRDNRTVGRWTFHPSKQQSA
jgi:hypothetical protein